MTRPGLGVMLRYLQREMTGGHNIPMKSLGKVIASVGVDSDKLVFEFVDKTKLTLKDEGQSCCEHRYMVCDDDLKPFIGATLTDLELADAPDVEDEYGETHEVQFLKVHTSKGSFTVSNHNEHNGYYGGFSIEAWEG